MSIAELRTRGVESWLRARGRHGWVDHLARAAVRYDRADGGRLAAAVTYYAFFATFALALLGFAVFAFVLDDPAVLRAVQEYLTENLPRVDVQAVRDARGTVGVIGFIGLPVIGWFWVDALRSSIRAVWGLPEYPGRLLVRVAIDLLVLVGLGLLLAASLATVFTTEAGAGWLVTAVGVDGAPARWLLETLGFVLEAGVNTLLAVAMLTALPRLRMPLRRVLGPALFVAAGLELLKTLGRLYVRGAETSATYLVVAGAVGLLVFLNVVNQLILFAATLAATSTIGPVTDLAAPRDSPAGGNGRPYRRPVGSRQHLDVAETLSPEELDRLDAYWRAANYLTVGQIYLLGNPLLREPLRAEHIKPRLLGHWGTSPGLNLLYTHLNRAITRRDLKMIYVTGPGHGGPAIVANTWLEGTYTEHYPSVSRDEAGMERLFRQFSFPGGIPSHVAAEVPGSIHEGGELGYSLMHAYGAAFDNPDLVVACVIGDGEAETGPLAASWSSNTFLDAARDGAVLPILHLNGYKIANPTVLARIPEEDLLALMRGHGYEPYVVAGDEPRAVHQSLAATLDTVLDRIGDIQRRARDGGTAPGPVRWPMIILRTPKGWTGPRVVDGVPVEGTFRAHQVPLAHVRDNPGHLAMLEAWLRSYRPEDLFDAAGTPIADVTAVAPEGERRMSASPHANGGLLLRDLVLPDFRAYAVPVSQPGQPESEATRVLGRWVRDVITANPDTFRLFGPDEIVSNRLDAVFEVTDRAFDAAIRPDDDHLAPGGRVMEVLSEHLCQGWLEGYLLTGRHGVFTSYEAFIHVVDSMVNQHAKWLKVTRGIPWRRPIASLNYLLSSHVWRQDNNGFSHQDPGFIDHVVNKKAEIVRVYLPPDANTLLSTMDHCLRSRHYINVVVAGKQPAPTWLSMDDAIMHNRRGLGIWGWASSDDGGEPDVVLACAGDVPTLETIAAAELLRQRLPEVRIRVVNVVDLMRLQPDTAHPHGLPDMQFDAIFTTDKPVIFAYHGYPALIHRLTYRRTNHRNLHVRGYQEEGTTTTPFDMVMLNQLDRFHQVIDVIDRVPGLGARAAGLRQEMVDTRQSCRDYTRAHGEDDPRITGWQWTPESETAP